MAPRRKKEPASLGKFHGIIADRALLSAIDGMTTYDPTAFGLPDLLIERQKNEKDENFYARQDKTIKAFVEDSLWLHERGKRKRIELIPQQVELLSDFFYRRVTKGIVWKNRGGGGTLMSAILAWMTMIYRHFSWVIISGNAEQSKQGYGYTHQFWECQPSSKKMLKGDPLQTMTQLSDGTYLKCLTNSEKSSRSKHPPGLIADEACQDDPRKDKNLEAALQMVLSNDEYSILVLSTFHHARGFFQKIWDTATERGFKRYKWDQFDTLKRCTVGMDRATPEDPKALSVCQTECPLTLRRRVLNRDGDETGFKFIGCNGRARGTNGYLPRDNAIDALRMNDQETASVEHWCERPSVAGPIYDPDKLDQAFSHGLIDLTDEERLSDLKTVGIDWGLATQTAIVGPIVKRKSEDTGKPYLAVTREAVFSGDSLEEITSHLLALRKECGYFKVYADRSHPFNNLALQNEGFDVEPVDFGTWKEFGIKNVARWLDHGALYISSDMTQLRHDAKNYHRDANGKPVKKADHLPDSLLCGVMAYLWEHETNPIEDTGETLVHVFKREAIEEKRPEAPKEREVRPEKSKVDPVKFRLRVGVRWTTKGPSGTRYSFRLKVPVVVESAQDIEAFRANQSLEEVCESSAYNAIEALEASEQG